MPAPAEQKKPQDTPPAHDLTPTPQGELPADERSTITNGTVNSSYLTVVYGMIKSHLRKTPDLQLDSVNERGTVDFYVDEGGNLVGRKLVNSSGSPDLDTAVMAAIAAAAPYPAPPNSKPIYLTYNFGKRPN